jgi:1-Cys peroxiredoxin 6
MDEIVRVVDALLLSAEKSVATPANWPNNHADQVGDEEAVGPHSCQRM